MKRDTTSIAVVCFGVTAVAGLMLAGLFSTGVSLAQDNAAAASAIFMDHECQGCHSIQVAKVELDVGDLEPDEIDEDAPDLSGVGLEHEQDWIKLYLKKKVKYEGEKHEKKFRGTDEEFETLTSWLSTLKTEPK
ncbi:MAG: c-type cytochrome [Candidatus Latescibacteria bacterium]|jgi:hypothetical protein|nr:c-type cytochrome [Candidatus Latescibacterota bacterium]